MNKKTQHVYKYYKVQVKQSELLMEFIDMDEFIDFVDTNKLSSIYTLLDNKKDAQHFGVSHKGGLLIQSTMGYHTLTDYQAAKDAGFQNATDYYLAQKAGYATWTDYKLVQDSGIQDKETFDNMQQNGFVAGFPIYKESPDIHILIGTASNAHQLYKLATDAGFDTFENMMTATTSGFKTQHDYSLAKDKGYATAAEYAAGILGGYADGSEYHFAKKLKINSRQELQLYIDLEVLASRAAHSDERVLLGLMSKLPQGKKVSINKIHTHLANAIKAYEQDGKLPPWFTKGFATEAEVEKFLSTDAIKEFGEYHSDGEYFETIKIQNRKVVLDGSNVAHNSQGRADSKPLTNNLLLMVRELKKRGFEEVKVISDASLKHRLLDAGGISQLKKECTYLEAPANITADVFIIQFVKKEHCLIVSNDTFREWKMKDPWVAENIDYYRLAFMIEEEQVLLPDLD